jgi:YD repeat-containing protein
MGLTRIISFAKKAFVFFLPVFFLLFIVTSSISNTAQYIYDDLGRLVKVIDDQGVETTYAYDAVGNLLSITTTPSASSAVAIVDIDPWSGPVGTTVTIYGKGFSTLSNNNTVLFNGVMATVISSAPDVVVTSVPAGATSGPVSVQTPLGIATSSKNFTITQPVTISISPSLAFVAPGKSEQFTATIAGLTNTSVIWSVNGIDGGIAGIGTIVNGLYTPPSSMNQLTMVTVSARSIADPTVIAEVPVYLTVDRIISNSVSVAVQKQAITQGLIVSPDVSVAVQKQAITQGLIVSPGVSVAVQKQAITQGLIISPGVSVAVQQQFIAQGSVVAPNISLYVGPYISSLSPASGMQGSNYIMTITGIGFSGVSAIDMYLNDVIDPQITVSNIQVNSGGTQITADVHISPTATADIRLVKVTSLVVMSQGYYGDGNIFNVTKP